MLVTDRFVFIHLPRTGGTFVTDVIRKFFPEAREIGYHLPRELLPREYSHLPILGTVRNPWAFYVSWYYHQYTNERYSPLKNVLFGCISEDRKLNFVQTIRNALNLGVSDEKLDILIQALPEKFDYQKRNIPNLTKDSMRKIRGTGLGLYTFRFNLLSGKGDDVFFCRVESLRSDLMAFFERIGVASDALRSYVLGLDKKNISEHFHYSTYYTPELAGLVGIRDRPLIERFGYVFEQPSLAENEGPKLSIEGPTTSRANWVSVKPDPHQPVPITNEWARQASPNASFPQRRGGSATCSDLHYSIYHEQPAPSHAGRSTVKKTSAKSEGPGSLRQNPPQLSDQSKREVDEIRPVSVGDREKLMDFLRQHKEDRNTRLSRAVAGAEPIFSSEPLIAYKYDPALARREEVVLTVKTTLQLEKNQRQEEYLKRPNAEVFGREAARPYLLGIVAAFSLAHDRFDWTLAESKWAFSAVEPYGIDAWEDKMALATAKSVQLIDIETGDGKFFEHPWLNQAHTVELSADGKKLLVGSAGFDAVFEFDTTSGEVVWEWFAWDHGFERSKLGHYVVRSAARYDQLAHTGSEVLLVEDPEKYKFGIPTRQKPAHLNSACYDSDGKILVTLFHQGAGYVVDRNTGEAREIISGLVVPHNLARRKRGGYFITDTRRGRLIFFDEEYRPNYEISLAGTPGIERSPLLSEFLQNTTELREDLFASIDIHRSSLWLVDVKRRRYRGIKFPVEWSVHDVASLRRDHRRRIGNLVGTQFGKVAAFARQLKIIHHFSVEGREVTALVLDRQGRNRELDV